MRGMNNRLTITAIITSVILLSGTLGFVLSIQEAEAGIIRLPPVLILDHYLDYAVKDKKIPKFQKFNVLLEDQFEIATYQVKKPVKLYNPVEKNGEDVIDRTTHYVGYKIKGPHNPVTDILVVNQFNEITVDTKKADLLLVPSLKSDAGPVAFGARISVDHFKCYKVEVTEGTPEFVPREVLLRDQFLDKAFLVKEPTRLCTPVIKNGEGGNDGGVFFCDGVGCDLITFDHLMCYKVKEIDKQPKLQKRTIWTLNQFGPDVLDVKKVSELCVPSLKNLDEPEPACTTDADCSDGDVCNGAETCEAGQCTPADPFSCNDGNVCTADACDSVNGCSNTNVLDGPTGGACDTGVSGVCAEGEEQCSTGALICVQTVIPNPEACDGLDNDCDGIVDNDNVCGPSSPDNLVSCICQDGSQILVGQCIQSCQEAFLQICEPLCLAQAGIYAASVNCNSSDPLCTTNTND